jgi:hypothetical protein
VRPLAVRRRRHGVFQLAIEAAAVWKPRERVLHRQFVRTPLGRDAPRDFAALQLEKAPGQREQSEAEQRRERERLVGFDDMLLRRHAGGIGEDVVFVGDQDGDDHQRQQQNAFPDDRSVAKQQAPHDGPQLHKFAPENASAGKAIRYRDAMNKGLRTQGSQRDSMN